MLQLIQFGISSKALVQAQCFLFDTLWNKAIPAQDKIKEIEEGLKRPFTETLRDPLQIQQVVIDLVNLAKQEILMLLSDDTVIGDLFSSRREHDSAQKLKIQSLLENALSRHGIIIRILTSQDTYNQIEKLLVEEQDIRRLLVRTENFIRLADTFKQQYQRLQSKVSFLLIDSKISLVEEESKPYSKNNDMTTLATYSNSELIVLAHISIFETLWTELKIKMSKEEDE